VRLLACDQIGDAPYRIRRRGRGGGGSDDEHEREASRGVTRCWGRGRQTDGGTTQRVVVMSDEERGDDACWRSWSGVEGGRACGGPGLELLSPALAREEETRVGAEEGLARELRSSAVGCRRRHVGPAPCAGG
jgi:hypothetical protein